MYSGVNEKWYILEIISPCKRTQLSTKRGTVLFILIINCLLHYPLETQELTFGTILDRT